MGNESDTSAMDVDLVKLGGSDQVVRRFSVNGESGSSPSGGKSTTMTPNVLPEKSYEGSPHWEEYIQALHIRFGVSVFEYHMADLMMLRQTGELEECLEEFEALLGRVFLPEEYAISCLLAAIKKDIADVVRMHRPRTLLETYALARQQNLNLKHLHGRSHAISGTVPRVALSPNRPTTYFGSGQVVKSPVMPGILPTPKPQVSSFNNDKWNNNTTRRLTSAEMDEKRRKGICFWCDEKFTFGHKCRTRQLHQITIDWVGSTLEEGEVLETLDQPIDGEREEEDAVGSPQLSLCALTGDIHETRCKMMRVNGKVKRGLLNILVDSGSTHNFLDSRVAKRMSYVAMAEARSQQAASLTEFQWLGHKFPISNAKTRVSILKAKDLEEDLYGPAADSLSSEKRLSFFDKIFTSYHEARSCIRSDLASAGNAESVKDDLNGLDKAISALLGQRTIDRNQLLVRIAKGKLSKRRDEKNERVTKPEEVVRLYDVLLQNAADLSDLLSSGRDRKAEEVAFAEELESRSLIFRAERRFYLARSYSLTGKRPEAYALYGRTRSLAEKALQRCRSWTNCDPSVIKELKSLHGECRSNSCIEHAAGIIEEHRGSDNLSKKVSALSLSGADKKVEKLLMEKLGVYESAVGDVSTKAAPRIVVFPPAFEAVPRNPIVLDLVYNLLEFPSLENRMRKDNKGFISRLWR